MVVIYAEGGGDGNKNLSSECRRAFQKLFISAGLGGRLPRLIACGSRQNAFGDFCTALRNAQPNVIPLLLVDSEAPVQTQKAWEHLKQRVGDGWEKPEVAEDSHAHLMVQCMETWFLTDLSKLEQYFKQGFRSAALPQGNKLEEIPKTRVLDGLKAASRNCKTKVEYSKGKHSFEILALLDAKLISKACPYAERLFKHLDNICG